MGDSCIAVKAPKLNDTSHAVILNKRVVANRDIGRPIGRVREQGVDLNGGTTVAPLHGISDDRNSGGGLGRAGDIDAVRPVTGNGVPYDRDVHASDRDAVSDICRGGKGTGIICNIYVILRVYPATTASRDTSVERPRNYVAYDFKTSRVLDFDGDVGDRSEERRVGKECR